METIGLYVSPRPSTPAVRTNGNQPSSTEKKLILEILVISQLVQDLLVEFRNLPEIRSRFRYETAQASGIFQQMRNRVKRLLPEDVFNDFENDVCRIVDANEDNVKWVRSMIATNMVNRISYAMVKPAVLIGMIGGLVDIIRFISQKINGRRNSDFDRIYGYLKYIDEHLNFTPMNDGKIDFNSCNDAMTKMFVHIGDSVDTFLRTGEIK